MFGSIRNPHHASNKKQEGEGFAVSFKPENFLPGLVIGFILGLFLDLSKSVQNRSGCKKSNLLIGKQNLASEDNSNEELKMVCLFSSSGFNCETRFKDGSWEDRISMCSCCYWNVFRTNAMVYAFTPEMNNNRQTSKSYKNLQTNLYGNFALVYENSTSPPLRFYNQCSAATRRSLLRQWEICGQPKIVLTCKNQNEMNRLKEAADSIGLPTFVVADAGRTQVSAGSKTVLAIGPGSKTSVDSVAGRLRLL